jgi:ABC-type uncharacterized transport system auxiliary subunit
MKRFLLPGLAIVLLMFLLQGCVSSPAKRYYQLAVMVTDTGRTVQKIGNTLIVQKVDVDPVYDDYRVVYRLSPYELNYYSYQFWVKNPGELVRDAMVEYLDKSGSFDKVITKFLEGTPELLLKAEINKIEEYDRLDAWFARLDMTITVSSLKSGEILLTHRFKRRQKLTAKKVEKLPIGLSIILEEELSKVIDKLALKINSK